MSRTVKHHRVLSTFCTIKKKQKWGSEGSHQTQSSLEGETIDSLSDLASSSVKYPKGLQLELNPLQGLAHFTSVTEK